MVPRSTRRVCASSAPDLRRAGVRTSGLLETDPGGSGRSPPATARGTSQVPWERASASRRYWCTNAIAMLPSPTAAATRFTGLKRTSPHGEDARDARLEEVRVALERPALGPAAASAPVSTYPLGSSATSSGSHDVSASAPMKMKSPPDSSRVVSPVSESWTSIASREPSPCAAVTFVRNHVWMFFRFAICSTR